MLYVCWNTLIFETTSLQFSHEYFKIEIEHSYAVRWIRWYAHAYLVLGRFPLNNGSGKLPWQSNAKQWKCFWISQFTYLGSLVFAYLCSRFILSSLIHSSLIIWIFPLSQCFAFIHSLIHSLLHFSANTTSLTFQRPYVCNKCTRTHTHINVDIVRVTSFGLNGHTLCKWLIQMLNAIHNKIDLKLLCGDWIILMDIHNCLLYAVVLSRYITNTFAFAFAFAFSHSLNGKVGFTVYFNFPHV